jgi:hypothetical protein
MRRIIIAATAAAALAGGAFAVSAQQDEEKQEKQRPQAQGQSKQPKQGPAASEDRGSGERQPGTSAKGNQQGSERRAEPKATDKSSDRAQSGKRDEPANKSVEQRNQAPKSEDKSTAQDKSEAPKKGTAERKDDGVQKQGTAERKQDDDAQKKGTAERKDEDSQKKGPAAAAKDSPDQGRQAQDSKGQRVELSTEQRTSIHTTIRQQNVKRVTNVNFSINIGARIPRTVTLHALPRTVVEIVPYYRGYRYVVVEDRICIVDPATYEIVYVIDESGPPSHTARLVLSSTQRQYILSNLDFGRPRANVSIRLALGAEIPSQVELVEFPSSIVATIPEIRSYRYVIVDRDIAVVDPGSRDVVLVIER